LKGRHFGILDNIQKSVTDELKGIPALAFQHSYEQWKQRLRRCLAVQGNFLKGKPLICKKNKIHGYFSATPRIANVSVRKSEGTTPPGKPRK